MQAHRIDAGGAGVGLTVSLSEAAALLGVCEATVRNWASQGTLTPCWPILGGAQRFPAEQVERLRGLTPSERRRERSAAAIADLQDELERERQHVAALEERLAAAIPSADRDIAMLLGRVAKQMPDSDPFKAGLWGIARYFAARANQQADEPRLRVDSAVSSSLGSNIPAVGLSA